MKSYSFRTSSIDSAVQLLNKFTDARYVIEKTGNTWEPYETRFVTSFTLEEMKIKAGSMWETILETLDVHSDSDFYVNLDLD